LGVYLRLAVRFKIISHQGQVLPFAHWIISHQGQVLPFAHCDPDDSTVVPKILTFLQSVDVECKADVKQYDAEITKDFHRHIILMEIDNIDLHRVKKTTC
jgi:hypothetical protein